MDSKIAIDANSKMFIFPSQLEKYPINFILEGEAKLRNMFYVRMIYFGDYSTTYEVWDGTSFFILKYIYHLYDNANDDDDVYGASFAEMEDEIEIHMKAASAGIAPMIEFAFLTEKAGIIVMEKLDFSLHDYLYEMTSAELFLAEFLALVQKLHSLNIYHGDLHDWNIMFKLVDGQQKLYLIDFGKSEHMEFGLTVRRRRKDYYTILDYISNPSFNNAEVKKLESLYNIFLQKEFPE